MEMVQKKKLRVALAGGGTAGHVIPALVVASYLKKSAVVFIGPKRLLTVDGRLNFPKEIKYCSVPAGKLRRYFAWRNFIDPFMVLLGVVKSLWILKREKINVLFCKGGFASIPPALAAWMLGIPIVLHESDSVPGLANRIIGKIAKKICLGFESAKNYFDQSKVVVTGNPVRQDFYRPRKRKRFQNKLPTIFIVGGSQGAEPLNELVYQQIDSLLERFNLIHYVGVKNVNIANKVRASCKFPGRYKIVGFETEGFADKMNSADLIVARSGAGVLSEIAQLGKPSILVPLPNSAQDHQRKNAQVFADFKAAIVLEQDALQDKFMDTLKSLLLNRKTLKALGDNAKKLASNKAAEKIANIILRSCQ